MLQWCYPFFREIEELTHNVYPLYFCLFLSQPAFEFNIKLEGGHWHVFLAFYFFLKLILMGIRLIDSWLPFLRMSLTFRQASLYGWLAGEECAVLYCVQRKKQLFWQDRDSLWKHKKTEFQEGLVIGYKPSGKGTQSSWTTGSKCLPASAQNVSC